MKRVTAQSLNFLHLVFFAVCFSLVPVSAAQTNTGVVIRFLRYDTNPTWEDAAAAFAAQDDTVSQVVLTSNDTGGMENFDCSIGVEFQQWEGNYVDLSPMIQADPTFNPDDLLPGTQEAITRNGVIYGYPLAIDLDAMRLNVDEFNRLGVDVPNHSWTTDNFFLSLQQLKPGTDASVPLGSYAMPTSGDFITHLVMADVGVQPLDSRLDPPTLNVMQPEIIQSIQRILDLARNGYIDYPENQQMTYAFTATSLTVGIWPAEFDTLPWESRTVLYPAGNALAPISYRVEFGYVHTRSQHPEACYRWFQYLSTRTDVVGIPVRPSQASQYATLSGEGEAFLELYDEVIARAENAQARLPQHNYESRVYADVVVRLKRAYTEYVIDGIPLETALANAQQDTEIYHVCMGNIPSDAEIRQMPNADAIRYDNMMKDCRRSYVPEIMWMYGG